MQPYYTESPQSLTALGAFSVVSRNLKKRLLDLLLAANSGYGLRYAGLDLCDFFIRQHAEVGVPLRF